MHRPKIDRARSFEPNYAFEYCRCASGHASEWTELGYLESLLAIHDRDSPFQSYNIAPLLQKHNLFAFRSGKSMDTWATYRRFRYITRYCAWAHTHDYNKENAHEAPTESTQQTGEESEPPTPVMTRAPAAAWRLKRSESEDSILIISTACVWGIPQRG